MIYIHESTQKHIDELVQLLNKERKEKKLIIKANKELNKELSLCSVTQQRELLLAFLKCYNNGSVTEYTIKEVDDFLKHNS